MATWGFFNFEPCYRVAMTACLDLLDHVYYKRYRWLIIAQYPWWTLDGHSITILISGHHNYYNSWSPSLFSDTRSVVDPDLELRGREGLIYLPCWLFSLLLFLPFLPKLRWGPSGAPPLDPPPESVLIPNYNTILNRYQCLQSIQKT